VACPCARSSLFDGWRTGGSRFSSGCKIGTDKSACSLLATAGRESDKRFSGPADGLTIGRHHGSDTLMAGLDVAYEEAQRGVCAR